MKKKKERSKWVARQGSKDSCEMCGWGEWGRWGHMCGSLKYLVFVFVFLFFVFVLILNWAGGVTKDIGLAFVAEEKRKEKKEKKKKKREMGWVWGKVPINILKE